MKAGTCFGFENKLPNEKKMCSSPKRKRPFGAFFLGKNRKSLCTRPQNRRAKIKGNRKGRGYSDWIPKLGHKSRLRRLPGKFRFHR